MRRVLRYLGFALGGLLLAAASFAGYVQLTGIPSYPVERVDVTVAVTPERVARGRRVASMLCAGCHLDPTTRRLSGKRMTDAPPEFGTIYSANITQHPQRGIGSWTDGELVYLLRTGIKRDGRYAPPYMPKLPHASDEDLLSIVAFLRSDDPMVRAADVASHPQQLTFLTKLLSHTVFKPLPYPKQPIVAPDPSDRLAYGKYLANGLLDCYSCHSADFKKQDPMFPERSDGFYGGGNMLLDAAGRKIYSANLTPHQETGIGPWSEDQFVRALKGGLRPDNTPILYPMQPYTELSDDEARSIYGYLRTLPAIAKRRPASEAHAVMQAASAGQQVYEKYRCSSCHGEKGLGLYDLRRAVAKYPSDEELTGFIRNASARVPGIKMPTWDGVIQEDEYPALVAYVRSLQLPEAAR